MCQKKGSLFNSICLISFKKRSMKEKGVKKFVMVTKFNKHVSDLLRLSFLLSAWRSAGEPLDDLSIRCAGGAGGGGGGGDPFLANISSSESMDVLGDDQLSVMR